jgi:hypothetical protein
VIASHLAGERRSTEMLGLLDPSHAGRDDRGTHALKAMTGVAFQIGFPSRTKADATRPKPPGSKHEVRPGLHNGTDVTHRHWNLAPDAQRMRTRDPSI